VADSKRLLEIGDKLAAELGLFLKSELPASRVTRIYALSVTDQDVSDYQDDEVNMRVFVLPDGAKQSIRTNVTNICEWNYVLFFFEKCTTATAGAPANSWVDVRTALVETVRQYLGDERNRIVPEYPNLRGVETTYEILVDQAMLREEAAFWSELNLTLREEARA
jgi:hypothetical protein